MFRTEAELEILKVITSIVAPISTMIFTLINTLTEKKIEKIINENGTETTTKVFSFWGKISVIGVIVSAAISLLTIKVDSALNAIHSEDKRQADAVNQAKIDSIRNKANEIMSNSVEISKNLKSSLEYQVLLSHTQNELLNPIFPLKIHLSYRIPFEDIPLVSTGDNNKVKLTDYIKGYIERKKPEGIKLPYMNSDGLGFGYTINYDEGINQFDQDFKRVNSLLAYQALPEILISFFDTFPKNNFVDDKTSKMNISMKAIETVKKDLSITYSFSYYERSLLIHIVYLNPIETDITNKITSLNACENGFILVESYSTLFQFGTSRYLNYFSLECDIGYSNKHPLFLKASNTKKLKYVDKFQRGRDLQPYNFIKVKELLN